MVALFRAASAPPSRFIVTMPPSATDVATCSAWLPEMESHPGSAESSAPANSSTGTLCLWRKLLYQKRRLSSVIRVCMDLEPVSMFRHALCSAMRPSSSTRMAASRSFPRSPTRDSARRASPKKKPIRPTGTHFSIRRSADALIRSSSSCISSSTP